MTIKPVTRLGDENLVSPSLPLMEFDSKELYELLKDMEDTMIEEDGIGIAAPQIGVNLQVVIFGLKPNRAMFDREPVPFTVLINPTLEPLSDEMVEDWEGCLSIPSMRGMVPRYKKVKYSGYDAKGNFFSRKVKDYHARVVQHECDHLNGILYPFRIKDMRTFGYEDLLRERILKSR